MALAEIGLVAVAPNAQIPVLWRLGRLFYVVPHVRQACIRQDTAFVSLELEGAPGQIAEASAYLQRLGLTPSADSLNLPVSAEPVQEPEKNISQAYSIPVRIDFVSPEQTPFPVLYRLGRDFEIVVNLLEAEFDRETGGYFFVNLSGPLGRVQSAIAYLHTTGLHIDPRQRSITDYSNL